MAGKGLSAAQSVLSSLLAGHVFPFLHFKAVAFVKVTPQTHRLIEKQPAFLKEHFLDPEEQTELPYWFVCLHIKLTRYYSVLHGFGGVEEFFQEILRT